MGAEFYSAGKLKEPVSPQGSLDDFTVQYEEGGNIKTIRKPQEPTREEWEEHMASHWPYRDWCPHCVSGRANNDPHYHKEPDREDGLPVISIDYMYMKAKGEKEEVDNIREMPILIAIDK